MAPGIVEFRCVHCDYSENFYVDDVDTCESFRTYCENCNDERDYYPTWVVTLCDEVPDEVPHV